MKTVALLGITQQQIRVKIQANLENQKRSKVLKLNIKTAGDWLKFKWIEKNLTLSHVAVKMGIAISLIRSWESSTTRPDSKQLEGLSYVLGFNAKDFETLISNPMNLPYLALENQT